MQLARLIHGLHIFKIVAVPLVENALLEDPADRSRVYPSLIVDSFSAKVTVVDNGYI